MWRTRVLFAAIALATGCASQPGSAGPGRPLRDTAREPAEPAEPLDPPAVTPGDGVTDTTSVWR